MTSSDYDQRQIRQAELRDAIAAYAPEDGDFTITEGIRVFRRSAPTSMFHGESSVCFCAIGQGVKHVEIGEYQATYGPEQFLITSVQLPMVSHVVEASPDSPYLSMTFDLTPGQVKPVLTDSGVGRTPFELESGALCTHDMETELIDATARLLRAQASEHDRAYLSPMIEREIIFRLLCTKHAGRLYEIAGMSSVSNQIKAALEQLRHEFSEPLRVADIARCAGMSVSSLHEHFKRVTGLTPLQYQKQLRLREARHLLLNQNLDAAEAGYSVGYTDASHFNRDYKRMFGLPPIRDIEHQRKDGSLASAS